MPIDLIQPRTVGQYFQAELPLKSIFRIEVSSTAPIRLAAMPRAELDGFLRNGRCTPFVDLGIQRFDDSTFEFIVTPNTPWLIVAVNQQGLPAAVYWRSFIRHQF
jgi:hypothetical protein